MRGQAGSPHARWGAPLALRLLRGFFPAMWGFALFCLIVAVAMVPLGPGPAFLLALAVQAVVHGLVLWRMIRVGNAAARDVTRL